MDVSAHGPNQPFSQPVKREVFSRAESAVYIYIVPVGSVDRNDYRILNGKWCPWAWTLLGSTSLFVTCVL